MNDPWTSHDSAPSTSLSPESLESLESSKFKSSTNKSLQFSRIFSRDPLILFLLVTFAIITNVFYTTDFRNTLENFFYDTRIKWMPPSPVSDTVIVVTIDNDSIAALERDELRLRTDGKKRPYLSIFSMTKAVSILANTDALAIALLMPEHAFPALDLDMDELKDIVKYDRRMIIGTTGYNQKIPNLGRLPSTLEDISDHVAGYETFRSRSNAVVRDLPYSSYRGLIEFETLPVKIAEIADPTFGAEYGTFRLKHFQPSHFKSVGFNELIADPTKWMSQLKNKIVVVGYSNARDAGFQTTEQMMAITPLTGPANSSEDGISTTWLTANAIENLLKRETMSDASGAVTMAQTFIVAAICGLSWEFGSLAASIATIFIWLILITVHSYIYSWFSLSIPLADTFLATVLISIFAAVRRLKTELMAMAEKEADAGAKTEIASIQSHFLAGFASWLKEMTEDVVQLIRQTQPAHSTDERTNEIYQRSFAAGEDFGEYLEAIRQIPEMESISKRKLKRQSIDLEGFIQKILRRFEIKCGKRNIRFKIDIAPNATSVTSNIQLLDAIIFNFVSNAVKYGPSNSTITIKARKISIQETSIGVMDHGPGIPLEFRERIFERFYRIRDDRIFNAKGTGLGLYLCKFFAEKLGGRVEIITEEGLGSEFRVILP